MGKFIDRTGQTFGRLTVVSRAENSIHRKAQWYCVCACGGSTISDAGNLVSGGATSCGCQRRESVDTQGGGYKAPEYYSWKGMVARCTNSKNKDFFRYGARGINVWPDWQFDFQTFRAYIGPKPTLTHSVDRINNERGYEPGNVRWATPSEQARNRRPRQKVGTKTA